MSERSRFSVLVSAALCALPLLLPAAPAAAGRALQKPGKAVHAKPSVPKHADVPRRPADARTANVRSRSVNNVNVNRNVNVDVDRDIDVDRDGCCYGGWDDDYHPVATAVAVGATVAVTAAVVGSIVNSVPANCVPVNHGGVVYQRCGNTWYQPQGTQFIVVNPPY
ncbi:hypothetical protein [Crenobacter caeni]|uniref:Secreted protein n=1 Tax=Crenobacter caeni TaxID=2705474 RepID=A0A6B2KWA4_9NEIS|nr:hypothetical protein [Crenobacter caeni]NDV14319.1 hypothetical protein [Crenobacter caeni]